MGNRAPSKLHTHWKGPMRVVENKGSNYTLHDLVRDMNINVHAFRLKWAYYDDSHIDPLYVAAKNYEADEVMTLKEKPQ